jgi:hypothetical protein
MIDLRYSISPSSPERVKPVDMRTADEGTLRYDLFLGDIIFFANGVDFSTNWAWVPILDAALVRLAHFLDRDRGA